MKELKPLPSKELESFSDQQLQEKLLKLKRESAPLELEIEARKEQRRINLQNLKIEQMKRLTSLLCNNPDLVNVLQPNHSCTNCSDGNLINGFKSSDVPPRCSRCALLEVVDHNGGEDMIDYKINLTFECDRCY